MSGDKIIQALDEVLSWSRGKGTLPVWLPDGTKADLTVEEYEFFRLGEDGPLVQADANSNKSPHQKDT